MMILRMFVKVVTLIALALLIVLAGVGVVAALVVASSILLPLSFVVVLFAVIRLICSTLYSAVFDIALKYIDPSRQA